MRFKFDAKMNILYLILIICDEMMNNEKNHLKQMFAY